MRYYAAFARSACLLGLFMGPAGPGFADTELNIPGYQLHWHDEFTGEAVDPQRWEVNEGVNAAYERRSDGRWVEPHWFGDAFQPWDQVNAINDERQYYSPDNVTVEEGRLRIRADEETVSDPFGWYDPTYHRYTSGKLNTADEFQFRYGIVRIRARQPAGKGLWPALWMLNAPDPWYWDDEIDIMEGRGSQPTIATSAHHFKVLDGAGNRTNQYNSATLDVATNLQTAFHEYSLHWEPDFLRTAIEGRQILYDTEAVPQDPMFLIINAAVGGHFDGLPDASTAFPTSFEVDWVRVWQEADHPSDLANGGFERHQGPHWADWNTRDDGNIAVVTTRALHGSSSVSLDRRSRPAPVEPQPDWLSDGTAGPWQGWLNELSADAVLLNDQAIDPATIPASAQGDTVTVSVHQSAPSPIANAVVFRQIDGGAVLTRDLTFTGSVTIEESFPPGSSARAFIRIFDSEFNTTDHAVDVTGSGSFTVQAPIPDSGVPFIQVGLETTGPVGAAGRLTASGLRLVDSAEDSLPESVPTGFHQTVIASPGESLRYGALIANHPDNPLSQGSQGQLLLQFLDANSNPLAGETPVVVTHATKASPQPVSRQTIAPEGTAFARLRIERVTTDPDADSGGAFIADSAFLQSTADTALPLVTAEPAAALTVDAGDSVSLSITASSPTDAHYQWFADGQPQDTGPSLSFTATRDSAATYYCVVSNDAGPVVAAVTELSVQSTDSDGDGLSDYDEIHLHGTDPTQTDTDGDGINDFDEVAGFQTDPLDPNSAPRMSRFQLTDDGFSFAFSSVPGLTYTLEGSPNLLQWQTMDSFTATSHNSTLTIAPSTTDPPLRFFRLRVPTAQEAPPVD